MILSICVACVSFYVYLDCYMNFVRKIDIPSLSSSQTVSVGYEKTPFAIQVFGSESDWNMLRARGTDDEEIWKLWTARSIVRARLSLFSASCGFALSLVFVFSLGVRSQMPNAQTAAALARP